MMKLYIRVREENWELMQQQEKQQEQREKRESKMEVARSVLRGSSKGEKNERGKTEDK